MVILPENNISLLIKSTTSRNFLFVVMSRQVNERKHYILNRFFFLNDSSLPELMTLNVKKPFRGQQTVVNLSLEVKWFNQALFALSGNISCHRGTVKVHVIWRNQTGRQRKNSSESNLPLANPLWSRFQLTNVLSQLSFDWILIYVVKNIKHRLPKTARREPKWVSVLYSLIKP